MFVALNENKNLIHITEAVRGLACNCTCFECGETVLARKGEINEHHFAHASNKDSCVINPESILHKYAKEVIQESMGLLLPAVPDSDIEATWWTFDRIIPEFPLGIIRPDLVGYTNEEPIFIEIAATHFIDEIKLNIIKSMNVKTVEIDLSGLLKSDRIIPSDDAKKLILESLESKTWLFPQISKSIKANTIDYQNQSDLLNIESKALLIANTNAPTWEDFQFTINGIWVHARKFSGGMLSVNCTYNPEIITMLKQWRNEGGGRYNNKYKSWNYWQPFSETVLERLHQMHSIEKR